MPNGIPRHGLIIADKTGGFQHFFPFGRCHGLLVPGFDGELVPGIAELMFADDARQERGGKYELLR